MENDSPKNPNSSKENKESIGSIVELLRSYETDVARLKGIPLKQPPAPSQPTESVYNQKQINIPIRQEIDKSLEVAGKPEISLDANGNTLETLKAANADLPEIPKEDPQKAIDNLHKDALIPVAHTIETDSVDAEKNKTSIEAFLDKQRLAQSQRREVSDPKRGLYVLVLSLVLVVGGLIALGAVYLMKTWPKKATSPVTNPEEVIAAETSQIVVMKSDETIQQAIAAAGADASKNAKTLIKLSFKEDGDLAEVMSALRFSTLFTKGAPQYLTRSLKPENLAGLYNAPSGWKPFVIFKLTSFESGFAGMLEWEKTMKTDLAPLISLGKPEILASSTEKYFVNPIIKTGFRDVIIRNKDTRVLVDDSGRRLFFYSFPDKDTLIITTDQATLEEIFARLTTSKFVR